LALALALRRSDGGWGVVLDLNLSNLGIGQKDAAMIG
jgi:hypothetical protein